MNYRLDLLQVQGEIKRKWRRWHLQRYMSSDAKYQQPSIGSSNNFSTQISMLTRCSPKMHRGSSSCHDGHSSIWVPRPHAILQNIRKIQKTKHVTHTPVIYTCTVLWQQDCKWLHRSFSRLKHHYSLMIRHTHTGRSLRHYAVDTHHVVPTSGAAGCHVLVGSGERSHRENVQSGAITPWLKTT